MNRKLTLSLLVATTVFLACVTPNSHAIEQTQRNTAVFAMPVVHERLQTAVAAIKNNQFASAHKALESITTDFPWFFQAYYLRASIYAISNEKDAAFNALGKAIEAGLNNSTLLQKDKNLNNLRDDPRFGKLMEKAIAAQAAPHIRDDATVPDPVPIDQSLASISATNSIWDPKLQTIRVLFRFNHRKAATQIVQKSEDAASKMLNTLFQRGLAAGNMGDIYDNRDRGHSKLQINSYPQLAFSHYTREAVNNAIDYGLNTKILFNAPTFGNSSTAVSSGPFWRSLARLAYTIPNGPKHLTFQYFNNHIYIYPAVNDYKDKQDHFPTNTPYMVITEGKSGSDKPFLHAVATIFAALRPAEKDKLIKSRKLSAAVQYILRRSQTSVVDDGDYLTSKAHPVVFRSSEISFRKMIEIANDLKADDFPAPVLLRVVKESQPVGGVDDFTQMLPEQLFDTPVTIARVIRNTSFQKNMTVRVASATNIEESQVSYKWVVLQGNPRKVKITPKTPRADTIDLTIDWHAPFQNANRPEFKSNRVEIGVFATNGKDYSAPSFVTFLYPTHQLRTYDEEGRLVSIDHRHQENAYIDPQIFTRRNWKDTYHYNEDGRLTGWTRQRRNKSTDYTRHGARVLEKDSNGRAVTAEQVTYVYKRASNGVAHASEELTGKILNYQYLGASDTLGILVRN
ncbi:tetratricopeptide repeat protein [Sneathiella glossodoripedis]|uniref:tetratricopeptide repeat protein n=1 Tax=Sneathiella glossodoripedis TaxID=418853 RepID=UPI00046F6395|nr:hypothetical protein [Sneathiella glossodoripedis]